MDKEIKSLIANGTIEELIKQFTLSERRTFFGYEFEEDIKKNFSRDEIVGVIKWFCD